MTTLTLPTLVPSHMKRHVVPLHNGDRLTQDEFHRRYQSSPEKVKAELIEGTVYMASPVGLRHGDLHFSFSALLGAYQAASFGTRGSDNATIVLGAQSEPQPDLHLRLTPECGGRSREQRGVLHGPPELVIEIAHSSRAVDLHGKRRDYQRAGVLEYLVLLVEEQQLQTFDFSTQLQPRAHAGGIYRSTAFPGLWIHTAAVLSGDLPRAMRTLNKGIQSPDHAAFVKRLKRAGRQANAGTIRAARK
ncbi:MAG TPA: Uma2 family endonuclease [Tepidisphaeraceae bacterium]|nr:Uma2 family endonuclease [Tepidisphaeraceae bacterium]